MANRRGMNLGSLEKKVVEWLQWGKGAPNEDLMAEIVQSVLKLARDEADATDSNQSMALTSGREIRFRKSSNIPSAVSLNFKVFCGSIWILAIRCRSIDNPRRRS